MVYDDKNYSLLVKLERLCFNITWVLFGKYTPPQLNFWRVFLLRIWGAKIAKKAKIYGSVKVWLPRNLEMFSGSCLGPDVECYNVAPIKIGLNSIVSQRSFLCTATHAYWDPEFHLISSPIEIGNNVWVSAECFVGPGVIIKDNSVYFARSYVTRKHNDPNDQRINP